MKIVATFLMIVLVGLLFMLPISTAVYDYRTDIQEEDHTVTTAALTTSANVSLHLPIYQANLSTLSFSSTVATDNAVPGTFYDSTSHVVTVNGLAASTTRDLTAFYDVNALSSVGALDTFLNMVPWLWYLMLVAVLGVAIFAIWRRGEM
jgi:microcystin-dependent protein